MDFIELINSTQWFFEKYGYLTIFLGSLVEITPLGWAVPGGAILALAGFFANTDKELNLIAIILSGTLGSWFTLLLAYYIGKKTQMWLVKKLHQEKTAAFAKRMLQSHGGSILTTSMMANLTRFWVAYVAGADNYNFWRFFKFSLLASLSWVTLMAFMGYFAGFGRGSIESLVKSIGVVAWLFLIIAVYFLYKSIRHEYQHFKKDLPHKENDSVK
ncbi:MAG TPA: VTT domain-containing protein [Patescibacteria group bacterium]|nr:VTT domain-containing protein [Patescibacteria group bacterium]